MNSVDGANWQKANDATMVHVQYWNFTRKLTNIEDDDFVTYKGSNQVVEYDGWWDIRTGKDCKLRTC